MSSSIDQQFIEFVVKSLVNNPDDVSIERTIDEKGVLLALTVNPEDLGRVIGKRGATAQSLRTLLRALGTKNDARYNLKIVDNGEPRPPREDYQSSERPADNSASTTSEVNDKTDSDESAEENSAPDSTATNDNDAEDEVISSQDKEKEEEEKSDHSDAVSKTRAELADLDDLDI